MSLLFPWTLLHLELGANPPLPIRHGHARSLQIPHHGVLMNRCEPGGSKTATASETKLTSDLPSTLPYNPTQSTSSQLPNGYPRKSSLSLELETDDSTSSDEQEVDPFNPDPSASDNDDDDEDNTARSSRSSALDDRPRGSIGSAPHRAPSDGSSSSAPSKVPFTNVEQNRRSMTEAVTPRMAQDIPSLTRLTGPTPSEQGQDTSPSSRAKDKKPPPPPKSHHGKRISTSEETVSSSSIAPSRSTNRRSYHASSPESTTSTRVSRTPNASSISQAQSQDYFSVPSDSVRATDSTDTLSRSNSQQKRPPTPPLSRRHSQMHRSKSTHSKSSGSRVTISSLDSESYDSSQPPSPGPSTRSVASSLSQDRKRISMPPPSSGEFRSTGLSSGLTPDFSYPPSNSKPSQPGRRASSHGCIVPGSSSTGPPPPPPPRRARDTITRGSEGGSAPRTASTDEVPLPQPSNAHDILADLSRLQKEVDDLRGHYENRKVSH